tara:strand:- start:1343 stop:1987 length:645 start_codon:yes stop_codon:yes gene_type:complete
MSNNLFIPAVVTYADELVSGTLNSYNTFSSIHEADYYHTRRLGNNAYIDASERTRTSALYWATDILNRQIWIGTPSSSTQKLAWPRKYVPTRNTINLDATSSRRRSRHERDENLTLFSQWQDDKKIPEFIKDATAELALYLIEREAAGATTMSQYDDSLSNLTLGGMSLQLRENPEYLTDMPYQVFFIVSDFLKSVKESDPSIKQVQSVNLTRR